MGKPAAYNEWQDKAARMGRTRETETREVATIAAKCRPSDNTQNEENLQD